MKASGIYAITHVASGRTYIGSAINIGARWSCHRYGLSRGKHDNPRLQNAWNKYGREAFAFSVVELVPDKADLIACEQKWIDDADPFYNILRVAGSMLGYVHSPETRARVSASKRGKRINAESRRGVPMEAARKAAMAASQAKRRKAEREKWAAENPGRNRRAEWEEAYKATRAERARAKYASMKQQKAAA